LKQCMLALSFNCLDGYVFIFVSFFFFRAFLFKMCFLCSLRRDARLQREAGWRQTMSGADDQSNQQNGNIVSLVEEDDDRVIPLVEEGDQGVVNDDNNGDR
jgi:hypothetical protein